MRAGCLIVVVSLLAISCSSGPARVAVSSPSPTSTDSPSPNPAVTSYGLLLSGGYLQMITPSGTVAASARVAAPSAHTCGPGVSALLQPPVSATKNAVSYRSGNTTIRYMKPDGENFPLTTVPGDASKISFFSVNPNGDRIAVLVEDFSPATTVNLTLYVEDIGHANHKVIYTNSTPKSKSGTTLWPMGWHGGSLVLAVFPVCKFGSAGSAPIEWHVANANTANRLAQIGNPCVPSYWPSSAGIACVDNENRQFILYDWTGNITGSRLGDAGDFQSGLSPSGVSVFLTPPADTGGPLAGTRIQQLGGRESHVSVSGHAACLWIDEDHLLAPDAVIPIERDPMGVWRAGWIALPASGVCAGRFPGGL